ncbi:MFS transporter [Klebsiella variicola subsp. variicola]|nr:MFS transporter [Klebsiella variicola subsp. variicola]
MLPVVLTMVSNWFPEKELGRANAFVMMFAPLGGMLTAPVSGAIIAALDWRWLFIIEGLLSLVVLVVWWFMISDRPQEAHWLPARERDYLVTTLAAERAAKQAEAPVSKAPVKDVFGNAGLMKLVILNFFYQTGDYGYTLWLPTILKGLTGGQHGQRWLLWRCCRLSPRWPGSMWISLFSDHSGKRRLWVRFSLYSFAAALVASVVLREHMVAAYIALVICGFFLKSATSPFWSMPGRIASPEVAGSARGVINGLGNLGGFCGPYLVGVMMYLYGQNVAVCALAGSLIIAGTMTFLLPKQCDLVDSDSDVAIKKQPRNA